MRLFLIGGFTNKKILKVKNQEIWLKSCSSEAYTTTTDTYSITVGNNINHETLSAKEAYGAHCRDLGVIPQRYRSDNAAVFTSSAYKKHLEEFSQTQKYVGVGQHHANGIVEKAIQDIQTTARTMGSLCRIPFSLELPPSSVIGTQKTKDF